MWNKAARRPNFSRWPDGFRQHYHLGRLVIHTGHGGSDRSTDISGVTYHIALAADGQKVAMDRLIETNSRGKVTRIVEKHNLQSEQVAHETGEQNAAVFAIAIRIIERFSGEEGPVAGGKAVIEQIIVLLSCQQFPSLCQVISLYAWQRECGFRITERERCAKEVHSENGLVLVALNNRRDGLGLWRGVWQGNDVLIRDIVVIPLLPVVSLVLLIIHYRRHLLFFGPRDGGSEAIVLPSRAQKVGIALIGSRAEIGVVLLCLLPELTIALLEGLGGETYNKKQTNAITK